MKSLVFLLFLLNFGGYLFVISSTKGVPQKVTGDNACTNFNNIFLEQDYAVCDVSKCSFKQCLVSNKTILMFMDIKNIKTELESIKRETAYTKKRQNEIFILSCFDIVVVVICFVMLICEIKFKLFGKIYSIQSENLNNRNCEFIEGKITIDNSSLINYSQNYLESLKSNQRITDKITIDNSSLINNFQNYLESLIQLESNKRITDLNNETRMNEIFIKMKKLFEPTSTKTKFKIEGYQDLFSVNFGEDETVVKIKKTLGEKISIDIKIMKMKLNGVVLDDNNILSTEIGIINDSVEIECYFDNQIHASEIIVINVACKGMNTKLIQMRKTQTIEDLKIILSRFNLTTELIFLRGTTELDKKKSINDLQLIDNDLLTVIQIETKQLKVSSIFDHQTTVRIDYSTKNKVGTLKQLIAHKNSSDPSLYALFIKNQCLDEEKYVYEYDIDNESSVQYCCIKELNGVILGDKLYKAKISELHLSRNNHTNQEMLLLKYDVLTTLKMKDNKHIIRELKVFQIAKLHDRFVKILDIYHKDQIICVAMENMSQGTLEMYRKKHSPLQLSLIQRWCKQILEGLEYLHNHELILRDLNPNHIFVDKDDNVKLYSFNVSKYKEFLNPSLLSIDEKSPGFLARYFAPEIFLKEPCDRRADIWSLGAVLIKLSTGKSPLKDLNKEEMIKRICENQYIEYDLPTNYNKSFLKDFIDSCLKPLEIRATVTQLKAHDFIRNI